MAGRRGHRSARHTEDEPAPEEPAAEAAPDLEETVMKVGYPLERHDGTTALTNLIHLLYSKQYLIGKERPRKS